MKIKMETWATSLSFKSVVGWINWDGFRNCERITYRCCGGLHKHLFLCRPCLFSSIVLRFISSSQVFLVQEDQQHRAYPILFAIMRWWCVIKSNRLSKVYVVAYVPIFQLWSEYLFKLCASFIIYFSIDSIFHSSYQQLMAFPAVLGA